MTSPGQKSNVLQDCIAKAQNLANLVGYADDSVVSKTILDKIAGTITLLYYLDKPGLLNHVVETQHKFEGTVLSSMHLHLTENKCLEIIAVRGKASEVKLLSQELMTRKGVKQLKLTVMIP